MVRSTTICEKLLHEKIVSVFLNIKLQRQQISSSTKYLDKLEKRPKTLVG